MSCLESSPSSGGPFARHHFLQQLDRESMEAWKYESQLALYAINPRMRYCKCRGGSWQSGNVRDHFHRRFFGSSSPA